MPFKIFSLFTDRNLTYLDVDNNIFDEDYNRDIILFGLIKINRGFKLRNTILDNKSNNRPVSGFKK